MRAAVEAHKAGKLLDAERAYRAVLDSGPHPGAAICLASLLLGLASTEKGYKRVGVRAEALSLSRLAIADVETRAMAEQVKLLARHAYFLLQFTGYVSASGDGQRVDTGVPEAEAKLLLQDAIRSLEKVTAMDPSFVLAWRNLSVAFNAAGDLEGAERAVAKAIQAAGDKAGWELHYKHGKALKRLKRHVEAVEAYCDACAACARAVAAGTAKPADGEVVTYWLRISLAASDYSAASAIPDPERPVLPASLRSRVQSVLTAYAAAAASRGVTAAEPKLVPDEYVRKLFDGYAAHFDEHLVGKLGYRTPAALLRSALAAAAASSSAAAPPAAPPAPAATTPLWQRCGDLGCGTGLAGVEFRKYVGYLSGCDLSGGMVSEAAKRGLYDDLAVAEVAAWLRAEAAKPPYDLLLAADVLVYIGSLDAVFAGAAEAMRAPPSPPAVPCAAPRLFVFSTEADLTEPTAVATAAASASPSSSSAEPDEVGGFRLTPTGRCVHKRTYIAALARKYGFSTRSVARQAIRQNAGQDVMGDLYVLQKVD